MKLTEKGDIRLYILTLMDHVDRPLKYSQINDIVLQDDFVSNFDFMDQFEELKASKLICERSDGAYEITPAGEFVANTLKSDIAGYVRERGIRHALLFLEFDKTKTKVSSRTAENDDGTFDLTLSITRKGKRAISVTVNAETEFQAERMADNFKENPEHLYKFIYSFLMGQAKY
ncbi:MAG: DUF4364 family protein [Clostridia bacterium]|nr:DUF4364 family protein [Clostridia bacterium]